MKTTHDHILLKSSTRVQCQGLQSVTQQSLREGVHTWLYELQGYECGWLQGLCCLINHHHIKQGGGTSWEGIQQVTTAGTQGAQLQADRGRGSTTILVWYIWHCISVCSATNLQAENVHLVWVFLSQCPRHSCPKVNRVAAGSSHDRGQTNPDAFAVNKSPITQVQHPICRWSLHLPTSTSPHPHSPPPQPPV